MQVEVFHSYAFEMVQRKEAEPFHSIGTDIKLVCPGKPLNRQYQ
jgi:hypothetical protein